MYCQWSSIIAHALVLTRVWGSKNVRLHLSENDGRIETHRLVRRSKPLLEYHYAGLGKHSYPKDWPLSNAIVLASSVVESSSNHWSSAKIRQHIQVRQCEQNWTSWTDFNRRVAMSRCLTNSRMYKTPYHETLMPNLTWRMKCSHCITVFPGQKSSILFIHGARKGMPVIDERLSLDDHSRQSGRYNC